MTPKQAFIIECASISSGTIATLTGETKYSALEIIQNNWLLWLEGQPVENFKNWQVAWQAWQES